MRIKLMEKMIRSYDYLGLCYEQDEYRYGKLSDQTMMVSKYMSMISDLYDEYCMMKLAFLLNKEDNEVKIVQNKQQLLNLIQAAKNDLKQYPEYKLQLEILEMLQKELDYA